MKIKLIDKIHETANVWSYRFEHGDDISWEVGQSIRIEVPRKNWGYNERRLTIASLPSDGYLQITTRISDSEFKSDLSKLKLGDSLNAYGIEGRINWGDLSRTKVFVAGGTGIVLFYIAIRQAIQDKLPVKICLLYSSRDTPMLFEKYLETAKSSLPHLEILKKDNRFDVKSISNYLEKYNDWDIHIAGPDNMVFGMRRSLKSIGFSSDDLQSNFLQ